MDNEKIFKEYWRNQILLERILNKYCIGKCWLCSSCFRVEDGVYNAQYILSVCKREYIRNVVGKLEDITKNYGIQSHCLGDDLQNKWYSEVVEETREKSFFHVIKDRFFK